MWIVLKINKVYQAEEHIYGKVKNAYKKLILKETKIDELYVQPLETTARVEEYTIHLYNSYSTI